MPPTKTHRSSSSSALRAHSRSSSSSKLGGNLQLTSANFGTQKPLEKTKKTSHEHSRNPSPLPRTQSAVRVDPREPHVGKRAAPAGGANPNTKAHGSKLKGFTINFDDGEEQDEDDAWVSESGADTPNRYSESDTDSDSATTMSATPVVRESAMRPAPSRAMKRTSSAGSTKRPALARAETMKHSKSAGPPLQRPEPPVPERVSQMGTKGPPSPISPSTLPPTVTRQQPPTNHFVASPDHIHKTQGPPHNGPPHLSFEEARAMRQQAQRAEVERHQRRVESDRAQSEFPSAHKVNGSPVSSRLPPPGQFLESQSRGGQARPPTTRGDFRLMEPTAAARFAQAIAAQDQDPDEIAAALSKPSSPNVREHRLHSHHRMTPSESSVPPPARTNGIKTDVSDHRRHSSLAVGTEPPATPDGSTSPKGKRSSRPSSVYSVASKHLRPHPLIRGQSHGGGAPLAPLAVISDSPSAQLSTSVPKDNDFPPSPVSLSTAPSSPEPPSGGRRSSISSARSVATLPLPQTNKDARRGDRTRTLSTISSSSTIAALSSLVNYPIVPSQRVSFFPHIDEEDIKKIHSLPPPGVTNSHLQYISHRSPLRESYDRIVRARAGKI